MPSKRTLSRVVAVIAAAAIAASTFALPALAADPTAAPVGVGTPQPPYPPGVAPSQFPVDVVGAVGRINFAVSPLVVETNFATKTGQLNVYNHGQYETAFSIVCYTYTLDDAGNTVIVADPTGIAAWFRFTDPTFILEPGTGTTLPFTVIVPPDATPGDHFVGVRITAQATDKAIASMPSTGGAFQLKTPAAVQVLVVNRVPGQLINKITAAISVPSFSFVTNNEFDFTAKLHDDGNTAVILSGGTQKANYSDRNTPSLTLSGGLPLLNSDVTLWNVGADGTPSDFHLLPGTGRDNIISWTGIPIIAHYDYTYTIPGSAADNRQAITVKGSFWVVNVVMLGILLAVLFLLVVLLVFWRWRTIRGRAAKTTKLAIAARRQMRDKPKAAEPKAEAPAKDAPTPAQRRQAARERAKAAAAKPDGNDDAAPPEAQAEAAPKPELPTRPRGRRPAK